MLNSHERIDQLYSKKVRIIQSDQVFSFSLDAVLLGEFASCPKHGSIVDLCAGNGAVGLFLSEKTSGNIQMIEVQPKLVEMAQRSIQLNHLEHQVQMHQLDLKDAYTIIRKDSVDVVTCNPPYFANEKTSVKNPNPHLALARHESSANLNEILQITSGLLKTTGKLFMVHRPDRLSEILAKMNNQQLAPKRIQFIYPKENKEANMVLIEAIKAGGAGGVRIMPPITVYTDQNEYTPLVRRILYGD